MQNEVKTEASAKIRGLFLTALSSEYASKTDGEIGVVFSVLVDCTTGKYDNVISVTVSEERFNQLQQEMEVGDPIEIEAWVNGRSGSNGGFFTNLREKEEKKSRAKATAAERLAALRLQGNV